MSIPWNRRVIFWFRSIVGASLLLFLVSALGESPIHFLKVLWFSAFGSVEAVAEFLHVWAVLLVAGIAVVVPFRAGLFNIGIEGQIVMSGLAGTACALFMGPNWPVPVVWILSFAAAVVAGAFWGFLPGFLKVKRGTHEVLSGIMLNFIAMALTQYLVLEFLQNPSTANPETLPVSEALWLRPFEMAQYSRLTWAVLGAPLLAALFAYVLNRSRFGFSLSVFGASARVAKFYKFPADRLIVSSLALGGALAAWFYVPEVLGAAHTWRVGSSSGIGYLAIAVGLLARGNMGALVATSFLFTFVQQGTLTLDLETEHLTRDFALVCQGALLLIVLASPESEANHSGD